MTAGFSLRRSRLCHEIGQVRTEPAVRKAGNVPGVEEFRQEADEARTRRYLQQRVRIIL